MDSTVTIALIAFGGTLIGSGGITALIQHFLSKKDKTKEAFEHIEERFDSMEEQVEKIDEKIDYNEAQRARTQILRFADEIYDGKLHSKEHFSEILDAMDRYNHYCEGHPDFKNMRTVHAQERINEVYRKCEKEHCFLDSKED